MSAASSFATFATYTPPPDELPPAASTTAKPKAPHRPWFPATHSSSPGPSSLSYQSGGLPSFGSGGGIGGGFGSEDDASDVSNQWQTRFGWRVDRLAATAYLGGPVTALIILVLETTNDYVRYHAYQSALLTTPLILIRILASLLGFPSWILITITIGILLPIFYMIFQVFRETSHTGLVRFRLPLIGELAERWVGDE